MKIIDKGHSDIYHLVLVRFEKHCPDFYLAQFLTKNENSASNGDSLVGYNFRLDANALFFLV